MVAWYRITRADVYWGKKTQNKKKNQKKNKNKNKKHSENADTSTSLIIVYTKMAQKDINNQFFFYLIYLNLCTIVIFPLVKKMALNDMT